MLKLQVLNTFRSIVVTSCKRSYFTLPYVAKVTQANCIETIVQSRRTQVKNLLSSGERYSWCVISVRYESQIRHPVI